MIYLVAAAVALALTCLVELLLDADVRVASSELGVVALLLLAALLVALGLAGVPWSLP